MVSCRKTRIHAAAFIIRCRSGLASSNAKVAARKRTKSGRHSPTYACYGRGQARARAPAPTSHTHRARRTFYQRPAKRPFIGISRNDHDCHGEMDDSWNGGCISSLLLPHLAICVRISTSNWTPNFSTLLRFESFQFEAYIELLKVLISRIFCRES